MSDFNGAVPLLDPSKKPIPDNTPTMTIFTPAGGMKIPLYAYRCSEAGIEFIPFLADGNPKDSVEIVMGQALISNTNGFSVNAEAIDVLYEERGQSLVLQG